MADTVKEIKDNSYTGLRDNISSSYSGFDLTILDFYRDNDSLGDFCLTMRQFNSTFGSKTKEKK